MLIQESLRQINIPEYRGIIFRRTFPRLGEIIDRTYKYLPLMGASYSGRDSHLQLPAWTFPSGAKIAFGPVQHEQDKYNYQGKEFHFLGFDQIEEFTESQYLFLMAQNRTTNPGIVCYVRSTSNPGGVGHMWVKKRFIDPWKIEGGYDSGKIKYFKTINGDDIETTRDDPNALSRSFVFSSIYDNPSITANDPQYVQRLEQLPEKEKRALLYGDWDIFAGQFFDMWRQSVHIRDTGVNPAFRKFISLDYGYSAPSSVGWWQVDYDGGINRYRELYRENFTYEQLGEKIKSMTPADEVLDYCVADPAIWGDRSHHAGSERGESGFETIQRVLGGTCPVIPGDNSRITGWGRMRIMLSGDKPQLTVSPACRDFIRTVPALIHDETKQEDVDTAGDDHAADETRYACMSRVGKTDKPKDKSKPRYAITDEDIERDLMMQED